MAYDPYAEQDQAQQQQMQNQLRQRMQRYGGVTPMNFNPQAQGAMGFAPSNAMPMGQGSFAPQQPINNEGQQWNTPTSTFDDSGPLAQPTPGNMDMGDPRMQGPQLPQHMQMQRNRMMQQRAMANRNNMMQAPPQAATPDMAAYKANKTQPDFMGMRNAADAARGAMTPAKPMGGMGRVAAGLGAAGSAMGLANQQRNKAKMAAKKPAAPKVSGGQLTQPPTFGGPV
jgi:hypothetical protein